jgi:hypothetical protein
MPAPSAYVIFMNHPHHYNLTAMEAGSTVAAAGFKIPEFGLNAGPQTYRDIVLSREKHVEIIDLLKSLQVHSAVPATFDGGHPEFALDPELAKWRLQIGEVYPVPNQNGEVEPGELESAIMVPETKAMMGVYRLQSGVRVIVRCPASDGEIEAYRRDPETFFGEVQNVNRNAASTLVGARRSALRLS